MSPNYEADPNDAKVVPRSDWYAAPAPPDEVPVAASETSDTPRTPGRHPEEGPGTPAA